MHTNRYSKTKKIQNITNKSDDTVLDNYGWIRDDAWPKTIKNNDVLTLLNEENNYSQNILKTLCTEELFREIKDRIKLHDKSADIKIDDYFYYARTEATKGHMIYCRKPITKSEYQEEVLLDVNALAKTREFVHVATVSLSPDHTKFIYTVDFTGNEKYTIYVKDINSSVLLSDKIKNVFGPVVWHGTMSGFFYTPISQDFRTSKVMYHQLGTDSNEDKVIFENKNPEFQITIEQSSSKEYLFISSIGRSESEVYMLPLKLEIFKPSVVIPKIKNIKYYVKHNGIFFYVMISDIEGNFRIIRSKIELLDKNYWEEFLPQEKDLYLYNFDITKNFIILNFKMDGLPLIKILELESKNEKILNFPDEVYTAKCFSTNFVENDIRIDYSSLSRPNRTYLYDFYNNKMSILKVQEIPSGHSPSDYSVKRLWADNRGTKIPISLVFKKSLFKNDGSNPLYLYAYGAYGKEMEPSFRLSVKSLLDRGFVYAIAHVRGGADLGYYWYLEGKLLNKKNTFQDFIECTKYLIKKNYTSRGNIVISGGSAGGLLIGAVLNMEPQLYKAAILHSPFVDVLNTMLDDKLPLTPNEYNEWGNPKINKFFRYIKSYSPYDNIISQNYPHIFVTVGVADPRVGYWEAVKWVAKLRDIKTDNNFILLKANLNFGHTGSSNRFDCIRAISEEFAFIMRIFEIII